MIETTFETYIYDAVRTPRGRGKSDGSLHGIRPIELTKTVLKALQKRNNLDTSKVEDVILGCVTPIAEQGGNIAKAAALFAGYHSSVSGVTLNRFCSSGLEAINQATASISMGYGDFFVAGGVESMSRVPIGSDGGALAMDPEVATFVHFVPQGISADLIATMDGFTRTDCDRYAVRSQSLAAQAWKENRFNRSIIPVFCADGSLVLDRDEHLRPQTTVEDLAKLKPSFQEMGLNFGFDAVAIQKYPEIEKINHVHHAGNSSGVVDGAAVVLLGNRQAGESLGLRPRGKIRSFAITSTEATIMLLGPAPASRKALQRAGLQISDIDLIEVNEAFASVVLHFVNDLKVDMDKVNVNGGAIALGHPLGATGAILLGTCLDELERRDLTFGLITLCVGGGMGIATIIERI